MFLRCIGIVPYLHTLLQVHASLQQGFLGQLGHQHAGAVIGRERLLGESLDYVVAEGSERTVDTHVKNIRGKLGDPGWVQTVRGFGYRFAGVPAEEGGAGGGAGPAAGAKARGRRGGPK